MPDKIEEKTRTQVARFLPDALATALSSYQKFAKDHQADTEETKDFTAHHQACKVAIAHIQLLIKLAEWAGLPDPDAPDHNNQILLAGLLQEAKQDINEDKKRYETEDD